MSSCGQNQRLRGIGGFSLVELMVALTISLFLLIGVAYIYTGSKQTYRLEENLARMQESGRLAFEYLTRDLRMAGYFGCATASLAGYEAAAVNNSCPTTPAKVICTLGLTGCDDFDFDPSKAVYGYEPISASTWSPALPAGLTGVRANTDVLVVRATSPTNVSIVHDPSVGNASLKVNTTSGVNEGDVLMASNCESSVIFQACNVNPGGLIVTHSKGNNAGCASTYGNSCQDWGQKFDGGSILKLIKNTYYIADNNGVPTLHRQDYAGNVQPLVPFVEDFQVSYGVAATIDGFPENYFTAEEVTDANQWHLVKSIRVELLVRSPEDRVTTDIQRLYFNGADVVPADRRLRLAMTSTIGIRNRILLSK